MALQWLYLVGHEHEFSSVLVPTQASYPPLPAPTNNLAFASDAGKIIRFLSGIPILYMPPGLVLSIGSMLGFIGYEVQYLFLTNQISTPPYVLLTVLAGNSICWINTVCYLIVVKNFLFDRQVTVGLSTSYQRLSAKLYADIADAFLFSSPTKKAKFYLLLNGILPLIVCFVPSPLVREGNIRSSRKLSGGFITIFIITMVTGTYDVITSLGTIITRLLSTSVILMGMIGLLGTPIAIPLAARARESFERKCLVRLVKRVHSVSSSEGGRGRCGDSRKQGGNRGEWERVRGIDAKEEIGFNLMARRVDFWLYFFVYLFGSTLGMVYLNNLGQIAKSP